MNDRKRRAEEELQNMKWYELTAVVAIALVAWLGFLTLFYSNIWLIIYVWLVVTGIRLFRLPQQPATSLQNVNFPTLEEIGIAVIAGLVISALVTLVWYLIKRRRW